MKTMSQAFPACGLLVLTGFWLFGSNVWPDLAREHGPMENLQAGFLLAGLLTALRQAWHEKTPGARILCVAMAWGYLTFLLLEFDVRPFQVKWLTLLLNGALRNIALALGCLLLARWILHHLVAFTAAFGAWWRSSSAILLLSSGIFWFAGAVAEHWAPLPKSTSLFVEELMETNAAWLMMLAAFAHYSFRIFHEHVASETFEGKTPVRSQ